MCSLWSSTNKTLHIPASLQSLHPSSWSPLCLALSPPLSTFSKPFKPLPLYLPYVCAPRAEELEIFRWCTPEHLSMQTHAVQKALQTSKKERNHKQNGEKHNHILRHLKLQHIYLAKLSQYWKRKGVKTNSACVLQHRAQYFCSQSSICQSGQCKTSLSADLFLAPSLALDLGCHPFFTAKPISCPQNCLCFQVK